MGYVKYLDIFPQHIHFSLLVFEFPFSKMNLTMTGSDSDSEGIFFYLT